MSHTYYLRMAQWFIDGQFWTAIPHDQRAVVQSIAMNGKQKGSLQVRSNYR